MKIQAAKGWSREPIQQPITEPNSMLMMRSVPSSK